MPALFELLQFKPHSKNQWEYCKSDSRFNIPICGRRWGKSQAAGHRMTHKSFVPDSYNWVCGPTYKLGEKEFRVVYGDYKKLGLLRYCKSSYQVKQGNMRIETPWGAIIEVVSAERQDSLLGEGLSHAIMSEAARHHISTWEQFVEPALSDLLGTADFPTTPKGFNWVHGLFEAGQDTRNHDTYRSWHLPSWTNPVRYPGGFENTEIQRIKKRVSRIWFDQEYGALFTAVTGSIYDEWDPNIHVRPITYNPNYSNFMAFDYGYANPFVCLDIMVTPNDDVLVWREYYLSGESTFEHGVYIRDRQNPAGYHVDGMWGDPRGADEAATLALTIGFPASIDVPWKHSVELIKRMLKPDSDTGQPKIYVDPSCTNLIRQMGQLHVKETRTATSMDIQEHAGDKNIQHKVDDHAADAFRYFMGPYFVLGAGTHLEDLYGQQYAGSESEYMHELAMRQLGVISGSLDTSISLTHDLGTGMLYGPV